MSKEVRLTPTDSVYTVKPLELRKYVQKFVEIVTIDGEKLLGTVYTIDPVSESVVLVTQKDGNTCMDIVMGHAVKSLVISSSNVCTGQEEIFPSVSVNISKEEAEARKKKIRSWLCKNRIPVEENGELLIVKDALQIYPPYGKDQCLSGNEIILGRVQDLIATMPDSIDM